MWMEWWRAWQYVGVMRHFEEEGVPHLGVGACMALPCEQVAADVQCMH